MTQPTILITGSTDGLGKLVARHLAEKGATVLLHGRNAAKGAATLAELSGSTKNARLKYYNADFSSLHEVRMLSEEIMAGHNRLDVLINNAGIGPGPRPGAQRELSADGYELRFAVNYLATFLLTHRLLPFLKNSAPARIINVASVGQEKIDFSDVMLKKNYDGLRAYRQSKLAMIMFTFDLAETLRDSGVIVNGLHPATLMPTNMVLEYFPTTMGTIEAGAEAVEYLALSPETADFNGSYFDGKKPGRAIAQAYDRAARRQLAMLSKKLIGLDSL